MTDTSSWHMLPDTNAAEGDSPEPGWVSGLRARCLSTMRDYREADDVMCLMLAPDVLDELEAAGSPALTEPDQYWPNREIPIEDLKAAAELERRARTLFAFGDPTRDRLGSWRMR